MPVLNEERYLAESVRRILAQDYPAQLELILALGPSRDGTTRLAEQIAARDSRVITVDNPTGSIPAGINRAIKAARHEVIARVDGHSMLPPGYLRLAVMTLSVTGAANVGGIMAAAGVTPFQQAVAWAMTSRFGVGASRFHTGGRPGPVDTVYLGVFRRSAIERVGGYDEEYLRAEDWELNLRIRQSGEVIWFHPGMRVTYRPRDCAGALGRQYFHYGRWRRVVGRQHPGTNNLRYLAAPTATAVIAAGSAVGLAGVAALAAGLRGPWPLAALAGLAAPAAYGAGVLAVSARAARQLRPSVAVRLPVVLATMHLAWGAGFLTSPRRLVPHGRAAWRDDAAETAETGASAASARAGWSAASARAGWSAGVLVRARRRAGTTFRGGAAVPGGPVVPEGLVAPGAAMVSGGAVAPDGLVMSGVAKVPSGAVVRSGVVVRDGAVVQAGVVVQGGAVVASGAVRSRLGRKPASVRVPRARTAGPDAAYPKAARRESARLATGDQD
jgi:succinoglycan biosynthesis protein ExoA